MKWMPLACILFSLGLFSRIGARAQEPVSLEAGGIDQGGFHFRVNARKDGQYRVEISSNLVDWAELVTLKAPSDLFDLSDPVDGAASRRRFYRAQEIVLSAASLRANETNVFSGDGTTLLVDEVSAAGWKFTVDGSETGSDGSGWISPNPDNPAQVFYTAPIVTAPRDVEICAEDRADPARKFCATLHIIPLSGTLVVRPGAAVLPLGGNQTFLAAADIPGVGLVPLNHALWSVNGYTFGTPQLGAIGFNGRYVAPQAMPFGGPTNIEVGFSLGVGSPVLAKADVQLVELKLAPPKIVFTDNAQTANVAATLVTSDGKGGGPVPAAALTFSSTDESIARVDPNGQVTAGTNTGIVSIEALHNAIGVKDFTVIEGRNRAALVLQSIEQRSTDLIRTRSTGILTPTIQEIEVTAPGAMLNINPDLYLFRGRFSSFANSFSAIGSPYVRIEGDGVNTFSYDPAGRVPQPSGTVAVIDSTTGFTVFGDKAGTGQIRMVYDDGYVQSTGTCSVTFTRLDLSATLGTDASLHAFPPAGTNRAYISEWLYLTVKVSNPRSDSTFIGNTPIRVRRKDGGKFFVATPLNHKSEGLTALPRPMQIAETTEFNGVIPGGENLEHFSTFGTFDLAISPRDAGDLVLVVSVPNDSLIPPVELPVTMMRPELRIRNDSVELLPGVYGAIPGSKVPIHSFVDFEQATGPALTNFDNNPDNTGSLGGGGNSSPLSDYDQLIWTIERPDHTREVVPYFASLGAPRVRAFGGMAFSRNFHQAGLYHVSLGYAQRSELTTEPLEVEVVAPRDGAFQELAAAEKNPVHDTSGEIIAPENQLSGIEILSPSAEIPWIPGTPITVTARTYDALGQRKVIGKRVRRITRSGDAVTETVSYEIAMFYFGGKRALPDANGIFSVTYIPNSNAPAEKDLALGISASTLSLSSNEFSAALVLPEEIHEIDNGTVVRDDSIPIGVASFASAADKSLLNQAIVFGGSGAVLVPRFLPVATQRLRDAVAAGQLPEGSDLLSFRMRGRDGFIASLDAGLPSLDLGSGVTILSARRESNDVVFTAKTDLAAFPSNSPAYSEQSYHGTLGNGVKIQTLAEFVSYRVETNTVDFNIPLNAAYSFYEPPGLNSQGAWERHEDGAVPLRIAAVNPFTPFRRIDLELRSSINACWDANTNGLAEPDEDADGDGAFTAADAAAGAMPFRGAYAEQPLIGFSRTPDSTTGEPLVRELRQSIAPGASPEFYVYGNISDHRTLDPIRMVLSEAEMPDGLPDFVSRAPNGEALIVRTEGGNMADFFAFSAFNLVARPTNNLPDNPINFSSIRGKMDQAYSTYSTFADDAPVQQAADAEATNKLSLYVDHEAGPFDYFYDDSDHPNILRGSPVPYQFFAGVLDQYYQNAVRGGGFGNYTGLFRLGQDGRIHDFEPRGSGGPTGSDRRYFGIDLDGALYDAISFNLPKFPKWPALPGLEQLYEAYIAFQLALTNRLDEDPNSPALRSIPVVASTLASTNLTPAGLVRGIGGSSGGYVDLNYQFPGSMMVESKTPGADLPGLHAGYPIDGRPEQLRDPTSGAVEDDLRDVLLKRDAANDSLIEEDVYSSLGIKQPRRVLIFGQKEDHKAPIRTGAKALINYAITTDPAGVTPADVDLWKFRSLIALREVPSSSDDTLLSASTQSNGNEPLLKLAYDTAVDVVVGLAADAILAVMTEGAYLECGGADVLKTAKNALINFSIEALKQDLIVPHGKDIGNPIAFANKVLNNGFSFKDLYDFGTGHPSSGITNAMVPIPGITFPGLRKLDFSKPGFNFEDFAKKFGDLDGRVRRMGTFQNKLYQVPSAAVVPFCAILNEPVKKLKDTLKSKVTAELLNGLGSADAMGTKIVSICIPKEAQVTNGLYSLTYMLSASVDVQPKEPGATNLSDLPFERVFGSYPFADEVSDEEFYRTLASKARLAGTPETRADAAAIIDELQTNCVLRVPRTTYYHPYKLRAARLPSFAAIFGPGESVADGETIGDFVLRPGRTAIPLASAAVAVASRSNENAGARANVSVPGYEMVLVHAVIRKPAPENLPPF